MDLREESTTTSQLRFPTTTSSLLVESIVWTVNISIVPSAGPSSIHDSFDHSFTDGVSGEIHFVLPKYGPDPKPLDWTTKT